MSVFPLTYSGQYIPLLSLLRSSAPPVTMVSVMRPSLSVALAPVMSNCGRPLMVGVGSAMLAASSTSPAGSLIDTEDEAPVAAPAVPDARNGEAAAASSPASAAAVRRRETAIIWG